MLASDVYIVSVGDGISGGDVMVAGYDSWLLRQADEYMRDCEPETDRDGESQSALIVSISANNITNYLEKVRNNDR